jgi:post-segregation antitoxin (ccd killing protein)
MPDHITPPEQKRRLRKSTNVSLPPAPVADATARRKQWLEANREPLDFWNDEIDRKGLPLDDFRQF